MAAIRMDTTHALSITRPSRFSPMIGQRIRLFRPPWSTITIMARVTESTEYSEASDSFTFEGLTE